MWTYVAASERMQDVDWALRREYLLTNGLGGYAASTILGCNTRRYHGLLVPALSPPLDRWVMLSHLDELLILPDGEHYLNTTEYRAGFYPDGFTRLSDFAMDPLPVWQWRIGGAEITKRIVLVHREDCTLVHYAATGDLRGVRLVLSPFVAMRSFHDLTRERDDIIATPSNRGLGFRVPSPHGQDLYLHVTAGDMVTDPMWYSNVLHRMETERGQEDTEDLLRTGTVTVDLEREGQVTLTATLEAPDSRPGFASAARTELDRRRQLLRQAEPADQREQALVVAADQFLVDRRAGDGHLVSVLAGYPWFADWGRDTMIALPGLCLATGRHDLARDVLRLWAGLISEGMLPNRFEDDNQRLSYNAVDSTLWFVHACAATWWATSDAGFLREVVWPAVTAILEAYDRGTRFGIRADADGLITAGDAHTQLTWMDAKRADVAFTPRHGKAVEVNALWVSSLRLAAEWAEELGVEPPAVVGRADDIGRAFEATFWNQEARCLYDCVTDGRPDATIRPNQLFAVSLPRAPITGERGRAVVAVCRDKLMTPFGLRTVAPDDASYHGTYAGGWAQRDGAYHRGTAWAWLLGAYVDALMTSAEIPSAARGEAQEIVDGALGSLDDGALGTIGEIFDGDAPHVSRGCVAQAWSVAEILRVKKAHEL